MEVRRPDPGFDWALAKAKVAARARQLGNDAFKRRKFELAASYYTKALRLLPPPRHRSLAHDDALRARVATDAVAALTNRALCHAKGARWDAARRDCARALAWDPLNVKALFRQCTALLALGRAADAVDALAGAQQSAAHPSLRKLLAKARAAVPAATVAASPAAATTASAPSPLLSVANNALYDIVSFLAPVDVGHCCAAHSTLFGPAALANREWIARIERRWGFPVSTITSMPRAVADAVAADAAGAWRDVYRGLLLGDVGLTLQVMNRETERNLEFAMSAYLSQTVTFRVECDAWHAEYENDGRGFVCETVDGNRLRLLPPDLADWTDTRALFCGGGGRDSFAVGDFVEIQWRRVNTHPFGWWAGEIERIWYDTAAETGKVGDVVHVRVPGSTQTAAVVMPSDEGGAVTMAVGEDGEGTAAAAINQFLGAALSASPSSPSSPSGSAGSTSGGADAAAGGAEAAAPPLLTKITVVFPQYLEESPWRRITVVLGTDKEVRSLGGWVGGIRPAAGPGASQTARANAKAGWEVFLPTHRIL